MWNEAVIGFADDMAMAKGKNQIQLKFLGGAGTVTGSKILLDTGDVRILIDCGLFQGIKSLRELNWKPLPVNPATIDALILTHAHLDHCGYIPVLVRNGFRGNIYCTAPTKDLAEIILRDSGRIQEEDAERANQLGYTRHKPAKPLYTEREAIVAMRQFETIPYHKYIPVNNHCRFRFKNTGHILGSAFVEFWHGDKKIVFSGDLGRKKPILLYPADPIEHADYIICESTYGDRLHPRYAVKNRLRQIIQSTYKRGGSVIIPTFAVERAQEIIYLLAKLKRENQLPPMKVYLDSPMGVSATAVLLKYMGWHRLTEADCQQMAGVVELVSDFRQSKQVQADPRQKIVLAGSGMLEGGRVLHYLENHIGDKRHTILLVGFQAEGTRGRALLEGAREIKFFGRYHTVKARVALIDALSAHADQSEIMSWLNSCRQKPRKIFLNHGEPQALNTLRVKIQTMKNWWATDAVPGKIYKL